MSWFWSRIFFGIFGIFVVSLRDFGYFGDFCVFFLRGVGLFGLESIRKGVFLSIV